MHFVITGLSYKTTPVEVREKLSFSRLEQKAALQTLRDTGVALEAMILSTCNRVEIHALAHTPDTGALKQFLADFHPQAGNIEQYLYSYSGHNAVRHVCRVAAGLDSMVIGEPQIFGQIKEAALLAMEDGAGQPMLKRLFDRIFSIVKKVRSKTKIGELPVSVSYAAVKLAQNIFGSIKEKRVMMLGAGDMGTLTIRNLISRGVHEVYIVNRTFQTSVKVSRQFNGTPIMIHELPEYLSKVDILISALTVPDFFLKRADIETLLPGRKGAPLFIIDISVPRSLDPAIGTLDMTRLYNIDDLQNISEDNTKKRQEEVEKSNVIIEKGVTEIMQKDLFRTGPESPVDSIPEASRETPLESPDGFDSDRVLVLQESAGASESK